MILGWVDTAAKKHRPRAGACAGERNRKKLLGHRGFADGFVGTDGVTSGGIAGVSVGSGSGPTADSTEFAVAAFAFEVIHVSHALEDFRVLIDLLELLVADIARFKG